MTRYCFIIILTVCSLIGQAQRVVPSKIPLSLDWAKAEADGDESVHLFLKGEEEAIKAWVTGHGGTFKYRFKNYFSVAIPVALISDLDTCSFITHVHFEYGKGKPLLSKSRIHTGVNKVHAGTAGLPDIYKGAGVIVGVIDAGIELLHPDFRYDNGNTRIIELWDQTMSFDAQRTPSYGYGQVWDSVEINDSICPHTDQLVWYGHGTNTAGIAAGDGGSNAGYTGMAPESELIIVSSDFTAIGWTNTVADAVDYIFSRAEALGKPCVINASLGTYLGSHDAKDPAAQAIEDDIVGAPGRIMVCAAGNSGDQDPYHLGYEASADTNFTWFRAQNGATPGNGTVGFEMYGDVDDFETVQFALGADKTSPQYSFRGSTSFDSVLNRLQAIYYDTIYSLSGEYLASVQTYADSSNGVYRLQVLIASIDSVDYNYRLSITGQGRFDLWSANWLGYRDMLYSGLPSSLVYPAMAEYKMPDIKQSIVSSWACSDKVITVGNMTNRVSYVDVDGNQVQLSGQTEGDIASNSSLGPARTGSTKPEVTAPGDNTITAGAFFQLENLLNTPSQRDRVGVGGLHHRAGGTSSASPVVAGIAALFLEKCPGSDWADFKSAITQNTYEEDLFTGGLPNDRWGFGKVNAVQALKATTPRPPLIYPTTSFCVGDSVEILLNQSYPEMLWSTGDSGISTVAQTTGVYFAQVTDDRGCIGFSDSVSIFRRPNPDIPSISTDSELPACPDEEVELSVEEEFGAYFWSNGANTSSILVTEPGSYQVSVSNQFDCTSESIPLQVSFHPDMPTPELHLRADGTLFLSVDSALVEVVNWYQNEVLIETTEDVVLKDISLGSYHASYIDSNGCAHSSNLVNVYALGTLKRSGERLRVYPNPFSAQLWIAGAEHVVSWSIFNGTGQVVRTGGELTSTNPLTLSELPKGMYMLKTMNTDGSISTFNLIK